MSKQSVRCDSCGCKFSVIAKDHVTSEAVSKHRCPACGGDLVFSSQPVKATANDSNTAADSEEQAKVSAGLNSRKKRLPSKGLLISLCALIVAALVAWLSTQWIIKQDNDQLQAEIETSQRAVRLREALTASAGADKAKGRSVDELVADIASTVDNWVYRPRFYTTRGDALSGTGCIVQVDKSLPPVFITANSLVGNRGGLFRTLAPSQMRGVVKRIELVELDTGALRGDYQSLALATLGEPNDTRLLRVNGVAAFNMPSSAANDAGSLATMAAKKGDRVWLLGKDLSKSDGKLQPHAATVYWGETKALQRRNDFTYQKADELVGYELDDAGLSPRGLLGAPVVNVEGEIVAIHSNLYIDKKGITKGSGIPTYRFAELLATALTIEPLAPKTHVGKFSIQLPLGYQLADEKSGRGEERTWAIYDKQLGYCIIDISVYPVPNDFDGSDPGLNRLMRNYFSNLSQGRSHTSSSIGEYLTTPGVRGIMGGFAIAQGRHTTISHAPSMSGWVFIGASGDDFIVASFKTDGPSEGAAHHIVAESALRSIQQEGVPLQQSNSDIDNSPEITIRVHGLAEHDHEKILTKLIRVFKNDELRSLSVDTVSPALTIKASSNLSLETLVDRIWLGGIPEINAGLRSLTYQIDRKEPQQTPAEAEDMTEEKKIEHYLNRIESKNWVEDTDKALRDILKISVESIGNGEIKKRVTAAIEATWISDPAGEWGRHKLLHEAAKWDPETGKRFLYQVVKNSGNFAITYEAMKALVEVADMSDLPLAVEVVLTRDNLSSGEAIKILNEYPGKSESMLLQSMNSYDDLDIGSLRTVIDFLGDVGGKESLAFFRQQLEEESNIGVQERLRIAIKKASERLEED